MEPTEPSTSRPDPSRRTFLRRSAVVGGALLWTAPAIQTIASPAHAQASPGGGNGQGISFAALLLDCGGTLRRIKFEAPTFAAEFGPEFAVADCRDQLRRNDPAVSATRPPATASFDPATGNLTVDLGGCTLVDYVVKCGVPSDPDDQGCEDAGEGAQTVAPGATGTVVFVPCDLGDDTPGVAD
ncbi:MAG TPA: twin-arginine translocation signal domain-containing protein [Mycobacteriales bacterium]|nr:twin-arginine translocation signal domain-containing protein [Mycobacteriales bacterium]